MSAAPASSAITDTVRDKYGELARRLAAGERTGCCGQTVPCECGCTTDPISSDLYDSKDVARIPEAALRASLGCGNPTALAELHAGDIVLDLGSGGGIDVLLSARRVGPTGKAYGLDMTDDMLALARDNARSAGATNVEFLKGEIEHIPLPDSSVDVIISNCVINLSANKRRVLAESFRVLKPGGRFAVSDVVVRGEVPREVRESMELWVGCIAGALAETEFLAMLEDVGFEGGSIEPTRVYEFEDARAFLSGSGLDATRVAREVSAQIVSAFVRATKPGAIPALRAGSAA